MVSHSPACVSSTRSGALWRRLRRDRGSFLTFLAGIRIRINNRTIDGRVYDFGASHQGDGVWRIDRVAGSTEPPSEVAVAVP